jgi:hypothetical protein
MTNLCQRLANIDSRFLKAERAYTARTLREGFESDEHEWPEGREVGRLSDERLELEELALTSGDVEAAEMVERRRQRDGVH